jgi:hypothetical protein
MGWLGWVVLMLLGLVFVVSLLFWLAVMVLYSLVAGWITGARPPSPCCGSATAPWPASTGRGARRAGDIAPPRADAAQATGAAMETGVQDVGWREVQGGEEAPARTDHTATAAPKWRS